MVDTEPSASPIVLFTTSINFVLGAGVRVCPFCTLRLAGPLTITQTLERSRSISLPPSLFLSLSLSLSRALFLTCPLALSPCLQVLGIPYAVASAGILSSAAALLLVCGLSMLTSSWLLEVGDRANALQNELAAPAGGSGLHEPGRAVVHEDLSLIHI